MENTHFIHRGRTKSTLLKLWDLLDELQEDQL